MAGAVLVWVAVQRAVDAGGTDDGGQDALALAGETAGLLAGAPASMAPAVMAALAACWNFFLLSTDLDRERPSESES